MQWKGIHIVTVLAMLALFSCQKELSYEGVPPLPEGDFTALVDGLPWSAADTAKGAVFLGTTITITGISADHHQLSMVLNDTVVGVYTLNPATPSLAVFADLDSLPLYAFGTNQGVDTSQASGVVTVTEIDKTNKTLSGSFSFKLFRDIDGHQLYMTQGIFYKLPYTDSLSASNAVDTLTATLDAVPWVAQEISGEDVSGQLAIAGYSPSGNPAISLIMPDHIAPGSYDLDIDSSLAYVAVYSPVSTLSLASVSGTLLILQNDPVNFRVRGNFQFTGADPTGMSSRVAQVTQGYFSVKYGP